MNYYQSATTGQISDEYQLVKDWPNTSFSFPLADDVCTDYGLVHLPGYSLPVAPPTPQEIEALIVMAVQMRLDAFARTRNYDSMMSACTYAFSAVPRFQAEGHYCLEARDHTWDALYTFMGEVQAGTSPMPTGYADIEPLLPVLAWPV